jgi:putative SOS response-associated peptidase YedK
MPADEFFERGHYFSLANHKLFAFAALWNRWRDRDGHAIDTCTLLTTDPNAAVESVGHTRMPVVLTSEEQYARWLNPEVTERGPLEYLLRPTPAEWWSIEKATVPSGERAGRLF